MNIYYRIRNWIANLIGYRQGIVFRGGQPIGIRAGRKLIRHGIIEVKEEVKAGQILEKGEAGVAVLPSNLDEPDSAPIGYEWHKCIVPVKEDDYEWRWCLLPKIEGDVIEISNEFSILPHSLRSDPPKPCIKCGGRTQGGCARVKINGEWYARPLCKACFIAREDEGNDGK